MARECWYTSRSATTTRPKPTTTMATTDHLGVLCKREHDHEGTGKSLRTKRDECAECCRERDRKRYVTRRAAPGFLAYQRSYQRAHFQRLKVDRSEDYKARNAKTNASRKQRKADDPEYAKALSRKSTAATRQRMADDPEYAKRVRAAAVVYMTDRRKADPCTALVGNLRNRLNGAFRTYSLGGKIRTSSEYGIDYTAICERLGLCPGPRSEWHIDHVRPLASFDLDDPDQVREAFAPENHQWLPAHENMSKGARREGETYCGGI